MLTLESNVFGRRMVIHPTLLFDNHQAVLVDVGLPGGLDGLRAAMEQEGVPFNRLKGVILTHQDIDHVGGIQGVLQAAGHPLDIYAHAEDQPYIEGEREPIKMNRERVTQMLASMPEEMRTRLEAVLLHPPTAKVTKVVTDGEVLPMFGGVQVIFTPGHTPGHISLYHQPTQTLIAGDASTSNEGVILGPSAQATPNMPLAQESHKKFATFDIARAICYHGGLCDDKVNEQFRKLAETLA